MCTFSGQCGWKTLTRGAHDSNCGVSKTLLLQQPQLSALITVIRAAVCAVTLTLIQKIRWRQSETGERGKRVFVWFRHHHVHRNYWNVLQAEEHTDPVMLSYSVCVVRALLDLKM